MTTTFRTIEGRNIAATDLQAFIKELEGDSQPFSSGEIEIVRSDDHEASGCGRIEYVHSGEGIIGIAWGGDAVWSYYSDLNEAIHDYFNDFDRYAG